MKKFIITFIFIILFVLCYIYRDPLYNLYRTYIIKEPEKVSLDKKNEYYRDYDFNYVQRTDDFTPESKQDLLNIYYTVLNSGVDNFSFYCPSSYKECMDEVKNLANDQETLSTINNFVHPYNSFRHLETAYDNYGKITLTIEKTYSDSDISLINAKVDEVEQEIWTDNMSQVDKIRAAHDYIINHSEYDSERSDYNIVKYKSDTAFGPLLEGYSLCGGYTDAMALFLEDLKIKNYKIASANHVWNALKLNDGWYHLDLTWDDPITTTGQNLLEYHYFLITTNELLKKEKTQHSFDQEIYSEVKENA